MKIIYNSKIPLPEFLAINIFGILFARKEYKPLMEETMNHEKIHTAQMVEMLFLLFYFCYFLEWIIRRMITRDRLQAYYCISFEREAYRNMHDKEYLNQRKLFSWIKYM